MDKITLETKEDNENLTYFKFKGKKYQVKWARTANVVVTVDVDEVQCVQKQDRSYLSWRLGGDLFWQR